MFDHNFKVIRQNMEEIVLQGPGGANDVRVVNSYPSKVCIACFQGLKSYAVQFFNGRRKHRKSDGKRHFRQHFGRMQSNNKWTYVRLWLWIADFKSLCGILGRILEIDVNARAGNGCVSKAQTFQCNRRINLQNLKLV